MRPDSENFEIWWNAHRFVSRKMFRIYRNYALSAREVYTLVVSRQSRLLFFVLFTTALGDIHNEKKYIMKYLH